MTILQKIKEVKKLDKSQMSGDLKKTIEEILDTVEGFDEDEFKDLGVEDDLDKILAKFSTQKPSKASFAEKMKEAKAAKNKNTTTSKKRKGVFTAVKGEFESKSNEIRLLEMEVAKNKALVAKNAKFKEKIGDELKNYLRENKAELSLGATPEKIELQKLRQKNRFYINILKGDKSDFLAIAQKIGYSYKNLTPSGRKTDKSSNEPKKRATASQKGFWDILLGR